MLRKVLLICGILASLVWTGTDILAALRFEGYSYPFQPISALSAIGAPTRPFLIPLLNIYVALKIAFALGVWMSAGQKRALRITATWFIGFITIFAMSIILLAGLITGYADVVRIGTLGWVMLAYPIVPSIIFPMFFTHGKKNGGIVPGAADNLSASALAVAMCRFLVKDPSYIPPDTEIRFISFGSEEAGLRGSRRYVERHLDELKRLDARLLNFETVAHAD